jgi:hypothetical protein
MEEVHFVLGMVAVLLVLGIVIVFTVKKKIEDLDEEFKFLERGSQNVANDLHRRIEDEVRELRFRNDEHLRIIEMELSELRSQIIKTEKIKKGKGLLKG